MGISLSIEDALQTISRSQASGVLKVGDRIEAVFVRGSLSHITDADSEEVAGICGLLQDAGCLADSVVELVRQANMAVNQLGSLLVSKDYLTDEEFRRARLAFQKNKLLCLLEQSNAMAEFSPDRTARSGEDSLNIMAAELLLDVVGMRAAKKELFAEAESDDLYISLSADYEVKGLVFEEVVLVTILQRASGSVCLAELERASLLSRSELFIALRSLREKRIVNLGQEPELEQAPEQELQVELDTEEEQDIMSDLFDDDLESSDSEEHSASEFGSGGYWGEQESPVEHVAGMNLSDESYNDSGDMPPPPELEPGSNRWADNEAERGESTGGFVLGMGLRMRMLNYRLTETTAVTHVVTIVTILYLVVLAWLMPNLLRGWFEALAEFSNYSGG